MYNFFRGPYTEIMDEDYARALRRIRKRKAATVVHHETCPGCGSKLVNLYRRGKGWLCRGCWEKHDKGGKNMKKAPNHRTADHEFYFTKIFNCPVCNERLASYSFGRAWTEDGLGEDKRKNCPSCGQEIDWTDVPLPHQHPEA